MLGQQQSPITINISHPLIGNKSYEFNPKDSVSDFRNTLSETTELYMYENYQFESNGKILKEYAEIGDELRQAGHGTLNLRFNPFDERSSKFHYLKVKDILDNPFTITMQNIKSFDECISSIHSSTSDPMLENAQKKLSNQKMEQSLEQFIEKMQNQELITFDNSKEDDAKNQECDYVLSETLSFSGFNPVPYYRKLSGDFFYVIFKSPQEIDYHISANSEGFYVNQSVNSHFSYKVSAKYCKTHNSLFNLICHLSPKLKQDLKQIVLSKKHKEFERGSMGLFTINHKIPWMINKPKDKSHGNRYCSLLGWKSNPSEMFNHFKEEIPSIKDWNEVLQIQHMQTSDSLIDRMKKQKLRFQIYEEMIEYAKVGVEKITSKQILPTNPNCPLQEQRFLYANLYFTILPNSFNEKSLQKLLTDEAAVPPTTKTKQINNFLINLQQIENHTHLPDVHLTHVILVQYKGLRFKVMTVPSEIIYTTKKYQDLESAIESRNMLGSMKSYRSENKADKTQEQEITKASSWKYYQQNGANQEYLRKVSVAFNLQFENVIRLEDSQRLKKVYLDNRLITFDTYNKKNYLYNIERLSARDYNYIDSDNEFYVYRPELISFFNQKHQNSLVFNSKEPRVAINTMLGWERFHSSEYKVFTTEKVKKQEAKLKSIGLFAKEFVINLIISQLEQNTDMKKHVADTRTVIEFIHRYGLNSRYLGLLYKKINKKKSPQLAIIIEKVIYVKAVKNIFNAALKATIGSKLRQLSAYLLNCLFFSERVKAEDTWGHLLFGNDQSQENMGKQSHSPNHQGKKNRKKKSKEPKEKDKDFFIEKLVEEPFEIQGSNEELSEFFLNLTPHELGKLICKIAETKYGHHFDLTSDRKVAKNEKVPVSCLIIQPRIFLIRYGKYSTLRDICLNVGISLLKNDYFANGTPSEFSPTFTFQPYHIVEFIQKVTFLQPNLSQLNRLLSEGDAFLEKFLIQESIDCYNKAAQYVLSTFGGNSPHLPLIHKKLSYIYFKIGDIETALLFGTNAFVMLEQFYGIEHIETIDCLSFLGVYHMAKRDFKSSEEYLMKAIYHGGLAFSAAYPQLICIWLNLATVYELQKKFSEAIMCLFEGLELCLEVYKESHLHTAVYYTALSSLHFEIPDILQAIQFKEKACRILKELLPGNDSRLKEANEMLQYYRSLQNTKRIKEIHQKEQRKLNSFLANSMGLINGGGNMRMPPSGKIFNRNGAKVTPEMLMREEEFWRRGFGKRSNVGNFKNGGRFFI